MVRKKSKKSKKSFPFGFFLLILLVLAVLLIFAKYQGVELIPQEGQPQDSAQQNIESVAKTENLENSARKNPSAEAEPQTQNSGQTLVLLTENLQVPECGLKNHSADHELRQFKYYSLCYRESYEQAEWSAECIKSSMLEKNAARSNDFRPDDKISTGSATLADYKSSGYDRGHLVPAADMSFDADAMSETFFMSNMSPQAPQFNRGIWVNLETQVRLWAQKFGKIYVVSGPVLNKSAEEFSSIGKNQVSVPEFYYKVILAPVYKDEEDLATPEDSESAMAIGFIIPNQKCDEDFWSYAVSIDDVEKITNIDFFPQLEDSLETQIEADFQIESWK